MNDREQGVASTVGSGLLGSDHTADNSLVLGIYINYPKNKTFITLCSLFKSDLVVDS